MDPEMRRFDVRARLDGAKAGLGKVEPDFPSARALNERNRSRLSTLMIPAKSIVI
jgi:hypothetical protein